MADSSYDKTIAPTPRRRQQAREQGQVAHSHELASAGMLIAGLAVLLLLGGKRWSSLRIWRSGSWGAKRGFRLAAMPASILSCTSGARLPWN